MTVVTSAALSLALPLLAVAPTAGARVRHAGPARRARRADRRVDEQPRPSSCSGASGMSIITRFHALWSAGAVTGGLVASRAAAAGISLRAQLLITAVVLVETTARGVALAAARPPAARRRTGRAGSRRPERAWPRRMLVRLFLVGMAIALAELPPNDWSALLMARPLRPDRRARPASASSPSPAACSSAGSSATTPPTGSGSSRTRRGGAAPGRASASPSPRWRRRPGAAGAGLFVTGTRPVVAVPAAVPGRQRPDPRLAQRHGGVLVRAPGSGSSSPHR